MDHIAIFDCAIKRPSIVCFNRLVTHLQTPFTYHRPPVEGLSSLHQSARAKGYIIFGSASNVEDRLDWHKELADFCRECLEKNIPVLGLCFGHQLMADSFGMDVTKNPNNESYYGSRKVTFQAPYGSVLKGEQARVFKAHSYQVSGPLKELEVLASSEECPYDGLFHPTLPYWGFQGHPEASQDFYQHEIQENKVIHAKEELNASLEDGLNLIRVFAKELC